MTRNHRSLPIAFLLMVLSAGLAVLSASRAVAQGGSLRIVKPQDGEEILGKCQIEVERKNEAQSYLTFKIAGKWITSQTSNHLEFDTREYDDGDLTLTVDYHDASGRRTDSQTVTIKVSNKVPPEETGLRQEGLVFRHYTDEDGQVGKIRRYLLTASARADAITIDEETGAKSEDDDGSAAAAVAGALDTDIALLLRQEVKEVHTNGSAVIKTIVQSGSERVREGAATTGEEGGGGTPAAGGEGEGGAVQHVDKPPWLPWVWSTEVGKWTMKKLTPSGWPIIATFHNKWPYQRHNDFTLADVTPALPDRPVKPGDSWSIPVSTSDLPNLNSIVVRESFEGLDYRQIRPRATIVPNLRSREVWQAIEEQKFVDVERRRWFAWDQGTVTVTPATREIRVARLESVLHILPSQRVQELWRDHKLKDPIPLAIQKDVCLQLNEGAAGEGSEGGEGEGEGGEEAGYGDEGGGGGDEGGEGEEDDPIKEIKEFDIRRFTYFDYENQRVLRIEDVIHIVYITEGLGGAGAEEGGMGGGEEMDYSEEGGGGEGGEGEGEGEASTLVKVTYNARIVTDADAWPTRPSPVWDREFLSNMIAEGDTSRYRTPRELRVAHDYDDVAEWDDHLPPAYDARQPRIR